MQNSFKKNIFLVQFLILFLSVIARGQSSIYEWENRPIRDDLYQVRNIEIDQNKNFTQLNQDLVQMIESYHPEGSSGRVAGITANQGQILMDNLMGEVSFKNEKNLYDPEGHRGFCFGRALRLHLDLLRYGVNKESIKKIFVVGPMKTPGKDWQFHVATIVKDLHSQQWWVLDTNLKRPYQVSEWMKHYNKTKTDTTYRLFRKPLTDRTKSLRFYITEPQKIGPNGWEYNLKEGGLFHESYNNYFKDMFKNMKANPIEVHQKFNFNQCRRLF